MHAGAATSGLARAQCHASFTNLQEWEISKGKQDKSLDNIERGLGTLGEMATAMGENLDHQDVLIDAVGEKVPTQDLVTGATLHGCDRQAYVCWCIHLLCTCAPEVNVMCCADGGHNKAVEDQQYEDTRPYNTGKRA